MKFLPMKLACSLFALGLCATVMAGPYTATKDRACPGLWEPTTKVIPVIWPSTKAYAPPPGSEGLEQIAAGIVADAAAARTHIESRNVIDTIDREEFYVSQGTSITLPVGFSPASDLLTVASECLVYRNLEVDSNTPSSAPNVPTNTGNGWIPAAVF